DYFPDMDEPDFAHDVFPALLDAGVPFHVHETTGYWNDVGSLPELLQGNFDAITGAIDADADGELLDGDGELVDGPVLVGDDVTIGADVRLDGPVVIGHGATIGDGAQI